MKKILLAFLILLNYNSFACSCNDIAFEKAINWADEIFFGRLIEIKEVEVEFQPEYANGEPYYEEKFTRVWYALFEVEKKWKGSSKKYIKVYQPSTSCDAGFSTLGRNYLVYAKKEEMFFWDTKMRNEKLTTWMCSRSRQFKGVNEPNDDLKKLDKKFPRQIYLINNNIKWASYFKFLIFLIVGFFAGRYWIRRTNT